MSVSVFDELQLSAQEIQGFFL
ncbi:Protein of unknown function [Bacillus thuringiensis]|uniref:Uncharacterized protein n=1 Tax=Bacillus thuringiensis TaxID=1428 RepID=A0A1C4DQD4_BACTU|nr:Protein of unknown function [Bacillus thuringiensis]